MINAMLNIICTKKTQLSYFSGVVMLASAFSATGEASNTFPGKYKAKLINVEAANIINLHVDVWSGYPRSFRISLPGISIPVAVLKAPACQLVMVKKAESITNKFITEAMFIEVKNIMMENTGGLDAISDVYTDKGSLSTKLKSEGLARPSSTKSSKPWC